MSHYTRLHLAYMQSILRSDRSVRVKLNELLPLRELLKGDVLGELDEVQTFVEQNWYYLSKILFYVRIYDTDDFQQELLDLLIKYTPPYLKKDPIIKVSISA